MFATHTYVSMGVQLLKMAKKKKYKRAHSVIVRTIWPMYYVPSRTQSYSRGSGVHCDLMQTEVIKVVGR